MDALKLREMSMKITLDNASLQKLQSANRAYSKDTGRGVSGIGSSYDISSTVSDGNTYGGQGMSFNEFKDVLKSKDVNIAQDYMTVMSNSMSEEDFAKLVKNGGKPESIEVSESVTILDRIKLAVAKGGTSVNGFTDTLSDETVEAMTGLKSLEAAAGKADVTIDKETASKIKDAVSKINEITEINDGMKKDLVWENKDLTIDNLYLAKHKNLMNTKEQGSEYFSVETPGYFVKKGEGASLEDLKREVTDLLLSIGVEANVSNVEDGMWLVENSLFVNEENIEKLREINSLSFPIKEEDISKSIAIALAEGKEPKDADLTAKETIYEKAVSLTQTMEHVIDMPFIKETRILEETRLKMLTEANLLLLKSNIHIDTKDIEGYVETLKALENEASFKEASELVKVNDTVENVKSLPAQILYPVSRSLNTISLEAIAVEGNKLKEKLSAANIAYEALGTEVRKDLGDSIKKAFRNIPEILESLGMENTEENNRAVRILGYNSMPVNKESIEKISEADRKLQNVLARLSPKDTLALIRENRSPIQMSVEELNEYLESKKDDRGEEIEKYSKFLYKLEQDKNITEEERKEYIEVYRFITKLGKTGFAAVGNVIATGREFTFENLRSAIKTAKHRGMDVSIGENFEKLAAAENEERLDREWIKEKFVEYRASLDAPEETVTELVMNNVPVSAENLEAALLLRKNRGDAFRKVAVSANNKAFRKAMSFSDALLTKPEAVSAYEEMAEVCKNAVYEECLNSDTYLDVRALQSVYRQISVASGYSRQENYEVPMEIGGQVTSVNVKLVHNLAEDSNVVVSLETEELGRVTARLSEQDKTISGYIACNLKETVTKMQKVADKLSKSVSVVFSKTSDTELSLARIPMRDNKEEVSSKELYDIAKKFLSSLKGLTDEN